MSREFDFVIYGASGFTGQYVLEELMTVGKDKRYKVAVAGRNENKLKKTLEESGRIIGEDLSNVSIIVADSGDPESLAQMAKRAGVVLNCVGPYRLYGEAVVSACVENGTSHVDVSGEPNFLEEMQAKYHDDAKEKGVYVVGSCGWDSIPCDLGVDFLKKQFGGDLNGIETFVQYRPGPEGYKINTGTYQTIILSLAHKDNLKPIRSKIMPDRLPKVTPKLSPRGNLFHDSAMNSWCVPFMGSDKSVAIRSLYYNYHNRNERVFQLHPYVSIGGLCWSLCVALWGVLLFLFSQFSFTRKILQNYPEYCTFGYFSSSGPSREQAKSTRFTYWFFGRGWTEKKSRDEDHTDAPTEKIIVRCDGTDAGYNSTSSCLVASAICIHEEKDKMPSTGGVYTPAIAFGQTDLLKRLADRDIHFKVVKSVEEE